MDLFEHFRTIWRWRWRVLAASLIVVAGVLAWSLNRPPIYQATALVAWTPGPTENLGDSGLELTLRRYEQLATTRAVLADAVRRSRLPLTVAQARERSQVAEAEGGGSLLALTATGASQEDAQALAQGLAKALDAAVDSQQAEALRAALAPLQRQMTEVARQLESVPRGSAQERALQAQFSALADTTAQLQAQTRGYLDIVSPAAAEPEPVSPKPTRDALLALLAALVVNAELAVVLSARSDRFSRERLGEEAAELLGVPVLAQIPAGNEAAGIEAFRTLRAGIMSARASRELRLLAVIGAAPRTGTTFVTIQLTQALSGLDISVLVVDANLRRPQLHKILGIPRAPGTSDVISAGEGPARMVFSISSRLLALPAGTAVDDPPALFSNAQMRKAMEQIADVELMIFDTPPLGSYIDALVVAEQCDAAVLVFNATTTSRRAVVAAANQLRRAGVHLVGVVANKTPRTR
jgi:succinoglycan biosynthesis transport protein ExoP